MQYFSKILSFVLVAHLLVATSGPPLVYHFCGEKMDSVAIGSAKKCDCNHEENADAADCCEKDCCHNELHVSEFHPNGLLTVPTIAPESLFAVLNIVLPFSSSSPVSEKHLVCTIAFDTHPPARSSDIPVLFRSLLI
ncbi:MAG: hypothetical protein MUF71_13805 [Candidatus Kapabacteria bacterium]|jgi:hypothetical protein|nr:hypothetical protein [Candidatus Kapabacteria bacterium]